MELVKMLEKLDYELVKGNINTEVSGLFYDSRKVIPGSVFICISGTIKDAHDYIPDVLEKGASVIVITKDVEIDADVTVIKVSDARKCLAYMSAAYFGNPADEMTIIGITGTKGKTTTAFMVYNTLNKAGIKCGLIGTIETIIGDTHIPASHSTPESYTLHETFRKMVDEGIKTVVMEVSSQGLKMHRVAGIPFEIGVFTNLEPDHIGGNEHPDFEDYMNCKKMLFSMCKVGLFNKDDSHFEEMLEGRTCEVRTFGASSGCDYEAKNVQLVNAGIKYNVSGRRNFEVLVNIPARFSVHNSLTALAICDHLGVADETIQEGLATVKVRGRLEKVDVSDEYTIMVDYAHNEMSLRSVLLTLKEYNPGRLICVFGCGGNRSRDRRFTMGKVSAEIADFTVITSDNPRFEEPEDIVADIESAVKKVENAKYTVVIDRYEAIKYVVQNAKPGDMILVAGKGHEDYQEIKGVKYHMDDVEMILKASQEGDK